MSRRNRIKRLSRKAPTFFVDDPMMGTYSNAKPQPPMTLEVLNAAVDELRKSMGPEAFTGAVKVSEDGNGIKIEYIEPASLTTRLRM